jgi:hypothetical protein
MAREGVGGTERGIGIGGTSCVKRLFGLLVGLGGYGDRCGGEGESECERDKEMEGVLTERRWW